MWYVWAPLCIIIGWIANSFCSANHIYSNNELADNWNKGFNAGYMDGYSTASKHYEEKIRSMHEQD